MTDDEEGRVHKVSRVNRVDPSGYRVLSALVRGRKGSTRDGQQSPGSSPGCANHACRRVEEVLKRTVT